MPKKVRIWFRENRARQYAEYWEFGTRHAKAFRDKAEARRWAQLVEHKFDAGEWRDVHGMARLAVVERFLQHLRPSQSVEKRTVHGKGPSLSFQRKRESTLFVQRAHHVSSVNPDQGRGDAFSTGF